MTQQEFQTQVMRLIETFGKQAYGTERVALIWREVRDFSGQWWSRAVDQFIGDCRQAPLLKEIRELAAMERERITQLEKRRHSRESEAAYRGIIQDEEIKHICKFILKRMEHGVEDRDFENFMNHMESATRGQK